MSINTTAGEGWHHSRAFFLLHASHILPGYNLFLEIELASLYNLCLNYKIEVL